MAEASSCPRASAPSTLGDVPVAFLITDISVLSQRTTTLHSSSQICSRACWEINSPCRPFQIQFLEDFPSHPFSQLKKKLAEVTAYNGQACVTDQMTPTPRPMNKGTFVYCILDRTLRAFLIPAERSCSQLLPKPKSRLWLGPGSSCVSPRPDKSQYEKNGEFPERTIV